MANTLIPPKSHGRRWIGPLAGAGFLLLAVVVLAVRSASRSGDTSSQGMARSGDDVPTSVVLISLDTTRRDHLSCYGYRRETTPEIDALARDSLRFTHAAAVSNWTLPTHASMLTGLYPTSHGAHWAEPDPSGQAPSQPATPIHPDCVTLAEILQSAGYATAAVVANAWLSEDMNVGQGFDHFDNRPSTPPAPYRQAGEITGAALDWLEEHGDRPFFLFLNYMDPHVPYNPPPPFNAMYAKSGGTVRGSWGNQFWAEMRGAVVGRQTPLADPIRGRFLDAYDRELAYLDSQLGRLFDWLRRKRRYDRTLIVVTADHGEAFGEHQILGHGLGLYEPEVAVPMILKLPGQARSGAREVGVQHTDILPTVVDVLGLETPNSVQGVTMLAAAERLLYVEEYVDPENAERAGGGRADDAAPETGGWMRFSRKQWALYQGRLKYIEYSDGTSELFDLAEDPEELHDLSDSRAALTEQMSTDLAALRECIKPIGSRPVDAAPLDAGRARQLKDLGYLQ